MCGVPAVNGYPGYVLGRNPNDEAQTDLTQCAYVLFSGKEWQASAMLANSAMPVQPGGSAAATPAQAFDGLQAAGYFGFAMATTISIWALSHSAGEIVDFIKRRW